MGTAGSKTCFVRIDEKKQVHMFNLLEVRKVRSERCHSDHPSILIGHIFFSKQPSTLNEKFYHPSLPPQCSQCLGYLRNPNLDLGIIMTNIMIHDVGIPVPSSHGP